MEDHMSDKYSNYPKQIFIPMPFKLYNLTFQVVFSQNDFEPKTIRLLIIILITSTLPIMIYKFELLIISKILFLMNS